MTAPDGEFRRTNGTFKKGNHYARGNPLNRRAQKLRAALLREAKPDDLRQVYKVLLGKALAGDLAAIREFLNRTVGKAALPVEVSTPDGAPLAGISLADVQLAVIEALSGFPEAKVAVAQKLKGLYDRSANRNGDSARPE
jgi:hypothetical protein